MKILWIGDGGVATGFARVNHSIIENLPKNWEIHHLAVNYNGDPFKTPNNHFLYPARLGGDILGINRIQPLIQSLKPDIIFILNDPWVINQYLTRIPIDQKVVAYTPVDAKPMDMEWVRNLQKINQLITYTEFGKSAFTDLAPDFNDIKVIPHGSDITKFYPIDRKEARKTLGIPQDAFIVFNGNRNQPRKRIDLTIKAFAKFAQNKPDNVLLYLHMGIEDVGYHIEKLCARYNVINRLIKTSNNISPAAYVSDEQLNIIYNSADVGINTSMGEGWGLVSTEQVCCNVAQIVPNYSATSEIFSPDEALHIDIERFEPHTQILTEGGVINLDHAAQCLETLYNDVNLRSTLAENASKKFTSYNYSWKAVTQQFIKIFKEVKDQEPKALKLKEDKKHD